MTPHDAPRRGPDGRLWYTLRQAAARCGWRRPNTAREQILPYVRNEVRNGLLWLDAQDVDAQAERLERERAKRGNWRPGNLGEYAQKGRPGRRRA